MIAPADWFIASDDLDPILRRIVGRKVRSVVRSGAVAVQDAADFEQELYLRLLAIASAFDPERSHRFAFATVIVDRAASKLLRDRQAQKRDPARVQRLAGEVSVEHDAFEQVDVAVDVAECMIALPDERWQSGMDVQLHLQRMRRAIGKTAHRHLLQDQIRTAARE